MGIISSLPNNTRKTTDREQSQISSISIGQNNMPHPAANINPLKQFYSSIQGLVPKMSNPDLKMRKLAAEIMLESLALVPIGAPI